MVFFIALNKGEPNRLITTYDSSNKSCGIDIKDKPFLYWPIPHADYSDKTTCVEECPQKKENEDLPEELNCNINEKVKTCK